MTKQPNNKRSWAGHEIKRAAARSCPQSACVADPSAGCRSEPGTLGGPGPRINMISCAGGAGPDWLSQRMQSRVGQVGASQQKQNVTRCPVLCGWVREIRMGDGVSSTSQPWLAVTGHAGGANRGQKKAPQKAPPGGGAERAREIAAARGTLLFARRTD